MARLKLYIANLGKYNEGELVGDWIELPYTEEELHDLFVRIKLGTYDEDGEYINGYEEGCLFYEEWAIHDYETDIDGLYIREYEDLEMLNEFMKAVNGLDKSDENKLMALMEWGYYGNNILEAVNNLDEFTLYEDITDEEDLGEYWLYDSGCYEIPEPIKAYIDCESFGRDTAMDEESSFTNRGYIVRE